MRGPWTNFSQRELRNLTIYVLGIMCYKFALEWYNGAFISLANERFGENRYSNIGVLTGINYAMQCLGSIAVAPLIKRFPTKSVLSVAVFTFGVISAILLVVDASTGGMMKFRTSENETRYGHWDPRGLFPIYIVSGISYGTVELIRRVIPRDIVGGDVHLLRKMDAIVHVLYEVAGTIGAFSSVALIGKFGYNYSFFLSPVLFTCAAIIWSFIDSPQTLHQPADDAFAEPGCMAGLGTSFRGFFKATYYGGFLVVSHRKFVWLISGYAFALYSHRYLENALAPIFAKQVLGNSSWAQIIVGGSNLGELFGAVSVLLTTNYIHTPIPWLRLDALALNIVWVLPFVPVTRGRVADAWKIAAIFLPISFGWAAGDVSLAAYIQATLTKIESKDSDVSALGAVMAFLYVFYIVIYAILSTVLGTWVDKQIGAATELLAAEKARQALKYVGGVQFTVLCVIVIISSFIPKGSFAFNPRDDDFNVDKDSNSVIDVEDHDTTADSIVLSPTRSEFNSEIVKTRSL